MSVPQKMKICVVGGGTAGYVTALILSRRLNAKIDMLVPKDIGIIGVGEGSTEHWADFIRFVDQTLTTSLLKTEGTIKSGIYFKDWMKQHDYTHSLTGDYIFKVGMSSYIMNKIIAEGKEPLATAAYEIRENMLGDYYDENNQRQEAGGYNQFHFNTHKLNEYLYEISQNKELFDITVHDDEVTKVNLAEDGSIKSVNGKEENYEADFFIDSTGFRRVLMNELGAKWVSYGEYLPLKEAIAFPTEAQENYNIYTVSQAMDAGWMWTIPVHGRTGNGYIYDSNFINKEQAIAEVEKKLGKKIEVAKHIKFDPGRLDKVWIKNCIAVGLSANFLEPLEATSIGTSIQQAFILMHRLLKGVSQRDIDKYNDSIKEIMHNARDFVALHYITDRKDTPFWKMCADMPRPEPLKDFIETWKERPLDEIDIEQHYKNHYCMFSYDNFNQVAYAHNLLTSDVAKKFNDNINTIIKDGVWAAQWQKNLQFREGQAPIVVAHIKHRKYIEELHRLNGDYKSIDYNMVLKRDEWRLAKPPKQ